MGPNIKNIVKANKGIIARLSGTTTRTWLTVLSLGCVMMLTLLNYEADWSDQGVMAGWGITLIGMIAIGFACGKKPMPRWSATDTLVVVGSLYYMVNAVFLSHTPVAHQMMLTGNCVMLYVFLRIVTAGSEGLDRIMVYMMAACGVFESIAGMLELTGVTNNGLSRCQMDGTFLNPGPMGIYLSVMLSACTCYYRQTHDRLIGGSIILMLMVIPATMSRTALIAYGFVLLLLFWKYILRYWKIASLLIFGFLIALYLIKRGSADSRTLMNIVAWNEWMHHPWWGCGVGGFVQTLAHGQMEYFATHPDSDFTKYVGSTDMAFNEYMKVMVEQGIVGLILMVGLLATTIYHKFKKHSPLAYAMIAFSVVAFFSYPFHLPQFLLIITTLIAIDAGNGNEHVKWGVVNRFVAITGLLVCTVFSVLLNRETDRRTELYKSARGFMFMHDEAFIDDYYELLPEMNDNREFLFSFGKTLRKAGRYNDSNAILRMETKIDTDPMAYVLMGRNYENMNLYDQADSLYRCAFLLQPNRIYPLYRQMKLYDRTGDVVRMRQKARDVVLFTPKIMSPAVKEMKKEAKIIVKNKK